MKLHGISAIILLLLTAQIAIGQSSYTSLMYSTGLAVGETNDFIGNYSWRGVAFESNWFVGDQFSLGFYAGWNVFFEKTTGEFREDTRTLSGTQQRYLNMFPILFDTRFHLGEDYATRPYFGLGVGTYRARQRTEMGVFYSENNEWQFGLAPLIGVLLPVGNIALNPSIRYNFAFATNNSGSMDRSYLAINVGVAWVR